MPRVGYFPLMATPTDVEDDFIPREADLERSDGDGTLSDMSVDDSDAAYVPGKDDDVERRSDKEEEEEEEDTSEDTL